MQLKSKKINAFTVSEMLVVLVISSIIISITLIVVTLVQRQIKSIQTIYKSNTELQLLERALWQDFNRYNISYNEQNKQLKFVSEIDSVFYTFSENLVIRNTDTLSIQIIDSKFYLDGVAVREGMIDALEFQLSKEIANKKLFIFKEKDASHYMN